MDAVKYITEEARMCNEFNDGCNGCPFDRASVNYCSCYHFVKSNPRIAVEIVEKWSKEHPVMTNRMKIKEVFGCNPSINLIDDYWLDEEYKAPKGE